MTIDVEKSTADGRRALKRARRHAAKVVDQARSIDVPTLSDLGVSSLSDLGHRLDHVPAGLEKAVERQVRAAKRAGRRAQRKGLVPDPTHSGNRSTRRAAGIVLVLGIVVAAVVFAAKKRRATDAADTPDPFGTAVREAEDARRAASSSVRA